MTSEQMNSVLQKYKKIIGGYDDFDPRLQDLMSQMIRLPMDARGVEAHVFWMCDQVPGFLEKGDVDKANRWLGFVQGCLWLMGLRTINDMRDDNRG